MNLGERKEISFLMWARSRGVACDPGSPRRAMHESGGGGRPGQEIDAEKKGEKKSGDLLNRVELQRQLSAKRRGGGMQSAFSVTLMFEGGGGYCGVSEYDLSPEKGKERAISERGGGRSVRIKSLVDSDKKNQLMSKKGGGEDSGGLPSRKERRRLVPCESIEKEVGGKKKDIYFPVPIQ